MCESFSATSAKQKDMFLKMLAPDVQVLNVADGAEVLSAAALRVRLGAVTAYVRPLVAHFSRWPSSPALRMFLESDKAGVPSYAADWFVAGTAPGLGVAGAVATSAAAGPVVIVYRVRGSKLERLWVGVSSLGAHSTQADVEASDEFQKASLIL